MASSAFRGPLPPRMPEQQQQPHLQPHHQWSPHTSPAAVPPSPHTIDSLARQLYRTQLEAASSSAAPTVTASSHGSAPQTPGSPGKDKPLPALPPARTPSQLSHQRQNQYPYSPTGRMRVASSPLMSIPAGNVSGPSRLPDHGHAGSCYNARQLSHPHFWLPNVSTPPPPQPQPQPRPSAPPPSQPPAEGLPPMPTPASLPDVLAPARRPLPAPPLRPVDSSTQAAMGSQTPLGEKARMMAQQQQQQQQAPTVRQPLPPSYETLFGGSLPSSSVIETRPVRPGNSTAAPPAASISTRPVASSSVRPPAPRSASTPVAVRKTPAPTTPSTSRRKPVPSLGTPTTPAASPAALKKGFTTSAEVPPASGQCWGIKRDGGRCTRAVGQSSRPVKSAGAGRTRHSSVSPAKSPASGTRQQQQRQRQRQKSAPPGAPSRPSSAKRDQHQGQGKKGRPIVVRDDSDPEFEVSTSSDESSILITASSREKDEEQGTPGDDDDDDEPLPLYCHQHAKEINKTQGFHTASTPSRYIPFSEYIPATISELTAARMRTAMVEPLSEADLAEEGYIYIYEILEKQQSLGCTPSAPDSSTTAPSSRAATASTSSPSGTCCTWLKVGRSVNPMARMAQWRSQCSSREAHLRALLPLLDTAPSQTLTTTAGAAGGMGRQGLLVGADRVLTRGIVGSHRWEKLVHLELRERCAAPSPTSSSSSTAAVAAAPTAGEVGDRCSDCGKRHREIFAVPSELGFEGVKEVVLRWERFVRELC